MRRGPRNRWALGPAYPNLSPFPRIDWQETEKLIGWEKTDPQMGWEETDERIGQEETASLTDCLGADKSDGWGRKAGSPPLPAATTTTTTTPGLSCLPELSWVPGTPGEQDLVFLSCVCAVCVTRARCYGR